MSDPPIRAFTRAYHNENDLPVRLRTFAALLASVVATFLFVTKLAIFSLGYLFPLPPSFITHGTDVTRGLGVALAVLWLFGLASNRFYRTLARPVRFFQKILTLKELEALQTRLERLCPPIFPAQSTWLEKLRDLGFYIYSRMISTLDSRKMLAD